MSLGGTKDENFSSFHSSCQLGLGFVLNVINSITKKKLSRLSVYFRCFSFFLVYHRSNYFLNHQVPSFFVFFSTLIKNFVYNSTFWTKIANVMLERAAPPYLYSIYSIQNKETMGKSGKDISR